ncbi:hypothetical protein LF1_41290 [Rubripirellula obstinata]|uniref:Uncharacterized protein n=1 Tax=Rubripirellula obstinata TaxID=406547 RepID=A0A5B1CP19_9BACT|nr:hypothetical protein [Rubripirellula obstinata]KAA1261579.1 hypothetical protein LF1_41290 [Rubripirellula obstinata]
MNVPSNSGRSAADPIAKPSRRPPQISLGFMLLSTVVLAVMSAGIFYASRVGAVQDELSVLSGGSVESGGVDASRFSHIVFIMFTFTSPLILAAILSTVVGVMKWLDRSGR